MPYHFIRYDRLVILVVSISIVDLLIMRTCAPISYKILIIIETSLMLGIFSITQGPSDRMVAGIIATAAFLAPLISTSPFRLTPPLITYFSKATLSFSLSFYSISQKQKKWKCNFLVFFVLTYYYFYAKIYLYLC